MTLILYCALDNGRLHVTREAGNAHSYNLLYRVYTSLVSYFIHVLCVTIYGLSILDMYAGIQKQILYLFFYMFRASHLSF